MEVCSQQGLLPKRLHNKNKNGVPKRMLVLQGCVVTIWAAVLTLLGGGANLAYSAAISLTTIIYMVSYILLFLSYFKLQRHPEQKRAFHVHGGKWGKRVTAGSGLFVTLFAFVIAFLPDSSVPGGKNGVFLAIVITGFVLVLALPFGLYTFYGKKHSGGQGGAPKA